MFPLTIQYKINTLNWKTQLILEQTLKNSTIYSEHCFLTFTTNWYDLSGTKRIVNCRCRLRVSHVARHLFYHNICFVLTVIVGTNEIQCMIKAVISACVQHFIFMQLSTFYHISTNYLPIMNTMIDWKFEEFQLFWLASESFRFSFALAEIRNRFVIIY